MNDIESLLDSVNNINIHNSPYQFNNYKVPRTTTILSKCIHNDSIVYWANSLGFKHQSYKKTLDAAANIGTRCHENIDMYLSDNTHALQNNIPEESINAYNSFLKWFSKINKLAQVEIVFHEKTLSCKYFGGTLDGLYKINNRYFLVDYKTSNHISYNYYLQLSAYRYMLRTQLDIEVDGCIILQLSKTECAYNEYVLDFSNPTHLEFINNCERTFLSLTYAYDNLMILEKQYNSLQY